MSHRLLLAADAGTPDSGNRCWVEVLVTTNGEVVQNHNKFELTRADLDTCAAQIVANGDKLPLDYDHSYVEGGTTVASGWFTGEAKVVAAGELRPDDTTAAEDELWAEVEWTPQAAADIREKRYRFISAEFNFAERDKKGVLRKVKAFVAATLTNRPFFNRMQAVTLSRITTSVVWDTTAGYQHIRDRLQAALNPVVAGEQEWRYYICDIDVAGLKALVDDSQEAETYVVSFTLDEQGEPTPADQSEWVDAEQQWVSAAKAADRRYTGREATTERKPEMDNTVLAKSLGLADDATEEQITTALAAATDKAQKADELATEVETLKGEKTELEQLREELATERKARLENERDQVITSAISEGRMTPAEKDTLVDAFGDNVEGLAKVLNARPKNVTLAREQGSGGDGSDTADTTEAASAFKNADGYDVDGESLTAHTKALELLGKDDYTEAEYLSALKSVTA